MPSAEQSWDVVIVGAGPAGLSAALVLGRCRRRVLLCDAGTPRNHATGAMHGFIGHDGIAPPAFRAHVHAEIARYPGVRFVPRAVEDAAPLPDGRGFRVRLAAGRGGRGGSGGSGGRGESSGRGESGGLGGSGDLGGQGRAVDPAQPVTCRKLLIATGLADELPDVPGLAELWGRTVHSCPYCDGWELSDAPIAAYGRRRRGLEIARALTAWTRDLVLCSDGPSGMSVSERHDLAANGVRLVETRVARLDGHDGRLEAVVFADGTRLPRRALFFDTPSRPQSDLAHRLGCAPSARGGVRAGRLESTTVPGVYVAGNILRDVQLAVVAAAEGCKAAFGINRSLTREDFVRRATGERRVEHPPVEEAQPSDAPATKEPDTDGRATGRRTAPEHRAPGHAAPEPVAPGHAAPARTDPLADGIDDGSPALSTDIR